MSRSSSGFESSHLPSPEYPAPPQTLTSTSASKTSLQSKPEYLLCVSSPQRPPKISLSLLSPAKGHLPSGATARSLSCTELRGNPAADVLRRSVSLTGLHRAPERELIRPKDWNLTPSVKTEESRRHQVNSQKHCEVMFPSSQSSTTLYNAVPSTLSTDTANVFPPKQAETTQSTHFQLPPTTPAERSNHPLTTPSLTNPHPEPVLTETACMFNYPNHISSDEGSRSLSANSEARRLTRKRNKKTSINSVNLGSLTEERLQVHSVDLKIEPLSDKVLASKAQ